MAQSSKIEWTDATWNPITGCSIVSPGCTNCYAMQMAGTRLKNHPSRKELTKEVNGNHVWTGDVRFNEHWLTQPLHWRKPRMIFVCAHGDLFHEDVPDEWIDQIFAVMALCTQHTFQVLTKRPERMREYLTTPRTDTHTDVRNRLAWGNTVAVMNKWAPSWKNEHIDGRHRSRAIQAFTQWPLPNVWLGTSIENQQTAYKRIPDLIATPAAIRFISAEPLLGQVSLRWLAAFPENAPHTAQKKQGTTDELDGLRRLDWVIVGGESGPKARPMHPDWARDLRDQCSAAELPFFFKQWGSWIDADSYWQESSASIGTFLVDNRPWVPSAPLTFSDAKILASIASVKFEHLSNGTTIFRIGKTRAGRLLDGVEHNAMPEVR